MDPPGGIDRTGSQETDIPRLDRGQRRPVIDREAAERRAHRGRAREMYSKSLEIWTDLTARMLVSPTDTFRLGAAARAVERAEAALGRDRRT